MAPLTIVIALALLATIAALGGGIISLMRGGEYDEKNEVKWMAARVGLQGLTFILLLVALFLADR